ncbi:MAG: GNAT family N-acetyltransferase [Flavobacteriaceae bacterium]
METFRTERLLLKPTDIEDAEFTLELMNSPGWIKFIGDRNINTIEQASDYIQEKTLSQYRRLGFGNFTVILQENGHKIGSCGLYDREGLDGVDLGFAFLDQYQGQGYAFEAAQKMVDLAFSKFEQRSIQAITTLDNFSSQNLLEKLNMEFQEMIRIPNDPENLMLFTLEK